MAQILNKEFILAEVKRTAHANGGKALGVARFLKETGIKESDWSGKYWANWGDAVREAGFEPNVLQSAYADNLLFEKLIVLTRELGHFPVKNELRLKAREDPSFPNDKTFARLGGGLGHRLAARVRDYCEAGTSYDDVILLCSKVPKLRKPNLDHVPDANKTFGFVYLMKSGRYYKIGRSNGVGRREYELGIQLPERVNEIHRIRTDDPAGIEKYWHNRFDAKRKNGEWFELTASDISYFSRRKFM